jgi:hypothetical protein
LDLVAFNAHFVLALKFAGSILLMLGFCSITGVLVAANMLVAHEIQDLNAFIDLGKFYAWNSYVLLFASVIVVIFRLFATDALTVERLKQSA